MISANVAPFACYDGAFLLARSAFGLPADFLARLVFFVALVFLAATRFSRAVVSGASWVSIVLLLTLFLLDRGAVSHPPLRFEEIASRIERPAENGLGPFFIGPDKTSAGTRLWTVAVGLHQEEKVGAAAVFADLNQCNATTHLVGQSTIFTLTGDRATDEAYFLAHHVTVDGGKRRLMLTSLRYPDTLVKMDGAWLFAERKLYVDWLEERGLSCYCS